MGKKKPPSQREKTQTLSLSEFAGDAAAAAEGASLPTAPRKDDFDYGSAALWSVQRTGPGRDNWRVQEVARTEEARETPTPSSRPGPTSASTR